MTSSSVMTYEPLVARPNVELTGAPRRVARAVRRKMNLCAARPWTHAVGCPVERNVMRSPQVGTAAMKRGGNSKPSLRA